MFSIVKARKPNLDNFDLYEDNTDLNNNKKIVIKHLNEVNDMSDDLDFSVDDIEKDIPDDIDKYTMEELDDWDLDLDSEDELDDFPDDIDDIDVDDIDTPELDEDEEDDQLGDENEFEDEFI
jgi:hypothetical protein